VRALAVAVAAALVVPAAALAHVTIQPSFVEDGVETEIAFQTPNERPPNETVSLSVKAPPGISIDSASSPPGWNAAVSGSTVTWTGGRLVARTTTAFPIHVTEADRELEVIVFSNDADALDVRWVDLGRKPSHSEQQLQDDPQTVEHHTDHTRTDHTRTDKWPHSHSNGLVSGAGR